MSNDPFKQAAAWFRSTIFREEAITPRPTQAEDVLPSPLRAARALEKNALGWHSRESIFLKQARLLAHYEDDYPHERSVTCYYPTYQSFSDRELRAYFAWRTRLRQGELRKACLSFVFLYLYELLNQIDVASPMDGFWKLKGFQAAYGQLDSTIHPYLDRWLEDYAVYYGLDPLVLVDTPQLRYDNAIEVLRTLPERTDGEILDAIHQLGGQWLGRSKFYRENKADFDRVVAAVLRGMHRHYDDRCKTTLTQHFFGTPREVPVRLFANAVFCGKPGKDREYRLDKLCLYRCRQGLWSVSRYDPAAVSNRKLETLMRTIDGILRELFRHRHPIRFEPPAKWIEKLIRTEAEALLAEKKAAEKPKLSLDLTRLEGIRRDAAITRDKLIVEEEAEEAPAPSPPPTDTPLTADEYRLLQCLLYGGSLDWVRERGLMVTVLTDSINEKLYETFCDTVVDDTPAPVEDYIEELKELVQP